EKKELNSQRVAVADGRILPSFPGEKSTKVEEIKKDDGLLKLYEEHGKDCVNYMNGPFALAIADGRDIFVARDPLGLKPLYYSKHRDKILFASEIKGLTPHSKDIRTFPPGHYYHSQEGFNKYFSGLGNKDTINSRKEAASKIRHLLIEAVNKRINDVKKPGIYLSGGIDSSVLVAAASRIIDNIKTFAVGTQNSQDLKKARIVADFIGTDHYQYIYNINEVINIIPEVVYQLESFDQYLVRSSLANYFVARLAKQQGVELVLCGEGGDELFGGYHYLKDIKDTEKIKKELKILAMAGHSNGFQRVDRINMAHSLLYDMPFMDKTVREYAFSIPVKWKLYGDKDPIEKWILRKAFENDLPEEIVWRKKEKFFKGAKTTDIIKQYIEETISDEEYRKDKKIADDFVLRSKEELYYYRIFKNNYPQSSILKTIGRTRTVS
ncbi:MAG TPA: asparagine synthase-related protein, partial [Halanaerobiales bacterium]|nr:asparagine synthase-related protein [Halanaerobiales bacterium]